MNNRIEVLDTWRAISALGDVFNVGTVVETSVNRSAEIIIDFSTDYSSLLNKRL